MASLFAIGGLGRTVFADLRALSTAQNDDISWTMSQLEVELLRLQNATQQAQLQEGGDLAIVRKRFDIFYSRITTFREAAFFQSFEPSPKTRAQLAQVVTFLEDTAVLIDSDDATLMAKLDVLHVSIKEIAPAVRGLALAGVGIFTTQEAERREALSSTLSASAIGLICLIVLLFFAVGILVALFRQGQRFGHVSEIARARFESAIASSLDAVLVVDVNGHIIEFNGAAETVFGYRREEALGADMVELVIPHNMRKAHRAGMRRFLRTGNAKVLGAGRIRLEGLRKSGEVFPVELSIAISEASGEKVFVSYLRDITSELQAEEELQNALLKAQEGEKAKSDLLMVMSHEMRTPLNGILGSLEMIDQAGLSNKQRHHLNSIAVSGELLLSHVNDVLDLSRASAQNGDTHDSIFDLGALVNNICDSLRAHAKARGNDLIVEVLTPDLGYVSGNQAALQRCLINLVGNAIKFTEDGAVIVEAERLASEEMVEIRVADTGVGIAQEDLDRIFEEFVTVDTAYDRENAGTGLGLAITKGLVQEMGGDIFADSELEEGSLFTIRVPMPVVQKQRVMTPRNTEQTLPDLPDGISCLVVDDNQINRDILTAILEDLGVAVDEASGGFEAIALAETKGFDLLLLDISMPEIDGIETLARIRAGGGASCATPAIAVTAHAAARDHENILQADFHSILVKPLSKAGVHQRLAVLFDLMDDTQGAENEQSDMPEFLQRFGVARFEAALEEALEETESFVDALVVAEGLTEGLREEAHRLSGSAAILGQQALWRALQDIQNVAQTDWSDARSTLLETVRTELRHARSSWIASEEA
nr:PAS domain-containing hybrid sensor histidine kinase/response regulator [Shimia marina]